MNPPRSVGAAVLSLAAGAAAACGSGESQPGPGGTASAPGAANGSTHDSDIPFVARLQTGDLGFQAGNSTRAVRFEGETLHTLATCVQSWNPLGGTQLPAPPGAAPLQHASFNGDEALHVSNERGYLGFSDGGTFYRGKDVGEELFRSKGNGYKHIVFIEGLDMLAAYTTEAIYFYDPEAGQFLSEQPLSQGIALVAGSTRSYATALEDHRIVVWPCEEGGQGLVLTGHSSKVVEMVYGPEDGRLASADASGAVIVWELGSGTKVQEWQLDVSRAVPKVVLAFAREGELLVGNGKGREIRFWSVDSGKLLTLLTLLTIDKFGVMDMDVSAGGLLAVGTSAAGRYDQNAAGRERTVAEDRNRLESGPALIFDISSVGPSEATGR